MTDDHDLFRTRRELEEDGWHKNGNIYIRGGKRMLPLYEAKMVHYFDHRWNSYHGVDSDDDSRNLTLAEKQDPSGQAEPRYWVAEEGPIPTRRNGKEVKVPGVLERLSELKWDREWLCGWRWVTNCNERTHRDPKLLAACRGR